LGELSTASASPERATQDRVIRLFRDELGWGNLGDWTDRPDNSNIDEGLLAGAFAITGDAALAVAARIDEAVKRDRPDGWRGVQAKEQVIKRAIYDVLQDKDEVERLFSIIKAQSEY